ncbi:PAAR domain-containing protein [Spirilliplanes yamanashiensis]|uniref:PAAR motif protein n=1 Tax=Spirilliplanes yamanashiensis TaxID=42233 RepID=A0A8J3Y820_9ACTN|nr:PAAR domain-containing protein [Spirilliplanes yamanashiensis]MDP9815426.1 putative Zn-binding protein involved in type VI secretion [Spirilliplanes yamanashiensis]GIJ03681.1 PAAR motif protein [Spirilliplanes yamanashiensis]
MPFGAKMGDLVTGTDTHIVLVPSPGGPVPTPTPLPFAGTITGGCSTDVLIDGQPAAVVGSTATNNPPHVAPNGPFQIPPTNQGTVLLGSQTVLINGKPAARVGDSVQTCNDPAPAPTCTIQGAGTVQIG